MPDASGLDAGLPDAGSSDAGLLVDAGTADAGTIDAGSGDAGMIEPGDAGAVDAGVGDGGPHEDAGVGDAGALDAGSSPDAGWSFDAGPPFDGGTFACGTIDCECNGTVTCAADQCVADNGLWPTGPVPSDVPPDSEYAVSCPAGASECIVTDLLTDLVWQQTLPANPCSADGVGVCNWWDAQSYCSGLSYGGFASGWRLPSYQELFTIENQSGVSPAIDSNAFPNTPAAYFWSSTPAAGGGSVWYVDFYGAGAWQLSPSNAYYVRCVR